MNDENEDKLECEDCLSFEGSKVFCPYLEEINDIKQEAILCDDCYHERCMEFESQARIKTK